MPELQSIVVVGAGAAGLHTAEALRVAGFAGRLTIVGEEADVACDRPPLSKQVLAGEWTPDRAELFSTSRLEQLNADWRLGVRAARLDLAGRTVELASGEHLSYGALVVATGMFARTLPHQPPLRHLHTLRTLQDALTLRTSLLRSREARRLVVIGAGFLGLEVAATARNLGCDVTVVEPQPGPPLASRLGSLAASRILAAHEDRDVRIITGQGVGRIVGDGDVQAVELTSGACLRADTVLMAIGAVPAISWLQGSGLDLSNGVVCDEFCHAGSGVWAVGDVASWPHPVLGARVRLEHRMNASEQARVVAANIMGAAVPFAPIPFFWTDHYDDKVQVLGWFAPEGEAEVVESSADGRSFVQTFSADGDLVGALLWNAPRRLATLRARLTDARRPMPDTSRTRS